MSIVSRFSKENAIMQIDAMFFLRQNTSPKEEFNRAKAECVMHLQWQIGAINKVSFEEYAKAKGTTKSWLENNK